MEEKTIKGIRYRLNEETLTAEVIQKKGYSGDIVIPEVVVSKKVSYKVVGIDAETFQESNITSITIPDSVKTIGNYAFSWCESLTSINIPDGVTTIGEDAFRYCKSLTSINIPDSVKTIGTGAFSLCESLTFINIPDGVTTIGDGAFRDCKSLTSINIPDSVTTIGNEAFKFCKSLTSINIPDSVTTIGNEAFDYCKSLTSINIPDSVTTIGDSAFSGCSSLTSITIPNGVTSIGHYAFKGCTSLTFINIPDSVTTIGEEAFYRCDSLTQMLVQEVEIDNLRFRLLMHNQCAMVIRSSSKNIESINNIPAKIDFNGVEYCVTTIEGYAFEYCKSHTSINIPDSVTTIGENAFSGCSSLTSITIPDSVTTIGENAFYDCSSLTSIIVGKNNKVYDSRDNCNAIIETATSTLIKGCQNTIIPNGVTNIGEKAFRDCKSLTSITIPNSVTTIGEDAFQGCSSLTSINIPDGVTSIGNEAFYGCSSLTSINIPDGVKTIGNYAFSWCESLTSINIPDSVTTIGDGAFKGCSSLTSITLPNGVTSIGKRAFEDCESLVDIRYNGTIEQWNKIKFYTDLGDEWNKGVPTTIAHCTDGDMSEIKVSHENNENEVLFDFEFKKIDCELTEDYIEETREEIDNFGVVVVRAFWDSGDFDTAVLADGDVSDMLYDAMDEVESFRDNDASNVEVYYSTKCEIYNAGEFYNHGGDMGYVLSAFLGAEDNCYSYNLESPAVGHILWKDENIEDKWLINEYGEYSEDN